MNAERPVTQGRASHLQTAVLMAAVVAAAQVLLSTSHGQIPHPLQSQVCTPDRVLTIGGTPITTGTQTTTTIAVDASITLAELTQLHGDNAIPFAPRCDCDSNFGQEVYYVAGEDYSAGLTIDPGGTPTRLRAHMCTAKELNTGIPPAPDSPALRPHAVCAPGLMGGAYTAQAPFVVLDPDADNVWNALDIQETCLVNPPPCPLRYTDDGAGTCVPDPDLDVSALTAGVRTFTGTVTDTTPSRSPTYTCNPGDTDSGTSCINFYTATSTITYSCLAADTLSPPSTCVRPDTTTYPATPTTTYTCNGTDTLIPPSTCMNIYAATVSCPNNPFTRLIGNTCWHHTDHWLVNEYTNATPWTYPAPGNLPPLVTNCPLTATGTPPNHQCPWEHDPYFKYEQRTGSTLPDFGALTATNAPDFAGANATHADLPPNLPDPVPVQSGVAPGASRIVPHTDAVRQSALTLDEAYYRIPLTTVRAALAAQRQTWAGTYAYVAYADDLVDALPSGDRYGGRPHRPGGPDTLALRLARDIRPDQYFQTDSDLCVPGATLNAGVCQRTVDAHYTHPAPTANPAAGCANPWSAQAVMEGTVQVGWVCNRTWNTVSSTMPTASSATLTYQFYDGTRVLTGVATFDPIGPTDWDEAFTVDPTVSLISYSTRACRFGYPGVVEDAVSGSPITVCHSKGRGVVADTYIDPAWINPPYPGSAADLAGFFPPAGAPETGYAPGDPVYAARVEIVQINQTYTTPAACAAVPPGPGTGAGRWLPAWCSDPTHTTQAACIAATATWTPAQCSVPRVYDLP